MTAVALAAATILMAWTMTRTMTWTVAFTTLITMR